LITGIVAGGLTARQVARREVEALREQLRRREAVPPPPPPPAPAPVAAAAPAPPVTKPDISEEITPEILMVLSAAVAAFLGKKARIRRARVAGPARGGSSAWAQQGRVFVQASHNLPVHH
jgi:methylmalonyl-CoA carboxyltransferase 12S subunit